MNILSVNRHIIITATLSGYINVHKYYDVIISLKIKLITNVNKQKHWFNTYYLIVDATLVISCVSLKGFIKFCTWFSLRLTFNILSFFRYPLKVYEYVHMSILINRPLKKASNSRYRMRKMDQISRRMKWS